MVKQAGVLMHISSLPSKYGIGTLGKEAYDFVDFLDKSSIGIWQILPLNVTSYGDSPYQSPSNFGLNYYFIDLPTLVKKGLLKTGEIKYIDWEDTESRVNYEKIFNNRIKVLKIAFTRFNRNNLKFIKFINGNPQLRDFALFMTLKEINSLRPWNKWEEKYLKYSTELEEEVIKGNEDTYLFYLWTQFEFLNEYKALKRYANSKGVSIMGDLPIYVAYDSVEVWKYPELFELDDEHNPKRVAGCPPDCFSADGQLWGNPLYRWDYHKSTSYAWWNKRIDYALGLYDLLRIDHFRGFSGYFAIPYGDKTARNGKWVRGPGFDLFKDKLNYPIIAEDLGMVDPPFIRLMKKTKYPGMKIVTQGFDGYDKKNIWRPSNYTYNFFSYTATHDSPTTRQYLDDLDENQKKIFLDVAEEEAKKLHVQFSREFDNRELTDLIVQLNMASKARVAMMPMQDLLAIGKEGRMNYPSTLSTLNWSFRITKEQFDNSKEQLGYLLSRYVKIYGRNK